MPSNHDARKWAAHHLGTCLPFTQTQGHCAGLVAWWIRARFQQKGEEFWTTKKYFLNGGPEYMATDEALTKSVALQNQMQGKDAYTAYIISGARADKLDKLPRRGTAKIKGSKNLSAISANPNDCAGIRDEFMNVIRAGWVGRFSITTRDTTVLHAVALDSRSKPSVQYFDPNLGEFQFMDGVSFCNWWCECYQDFGFDMESGSSGKSAFGIMSDRFSAEYFGI